MKYSKGITKSDRIKGFISDAIKDPKGIVESVKFGLRLRLRSFNNPVFAKKIEGLFLPSNAIIMCILALASYIFIFGPGAHPTFSTIVLFMAFSSLSFVVMEFISKHVTDPEKFNITSLRLTIVSLIIPLMLMHTVGMPQMFVFGIITFLIMSPLVFVIRSKWKISGHTCTFTAITTIMSMANGWFAALYLIIPVISWSRLKLKAHTKAQVIVGMLIGFFTPLTFSVVLLA